MKLETTKEIKKWCTNLIPRIEKLQKERIEAMESLEPTFYSNDDFKYHLESNGEQYHRGYIHALKDIIDMIE